MVAGVEFYLRFMVHGLGIPSYFAAFETGQGTAPTPPESTLQVGPP